MLQNDMDEPKPSGKDELLATLYRKHGRELIGRLRRVFGAGPPDAEDLAQAAFESLARMNSLSEVRDLRAFAFRVAMNSGLDHIDRQRTARLFRENFAFMTDTLQNPSPETVYLDNEQWRQVGNMIDALPDLDKELIYRSRFKGETLASIAADKNMNTSTVSRKLAKIMSDLRSRMQVVENDQG